MKYATLVTTLYFFVSTMHSSYVETAKGINFYQGSLSEALATAKQEEKPVFVYVYATWCGQCKNLKKSFKDDDTAAYFNTNFINVAIDGETEEGGGVLLKYWIKAYPTLLILDGSGRIQTKTTGYLTPYLLTNFGKRIIQN